jgi:hypothetical protein
MALFFRLNAFSDATWASTQLMPWTLAEPGVIFICACLPALWPMIIFFMPNLFGSRVKSGNKASHYGQIGSNQRGVESSFHGHSQGLASRHDDSFPLNDREEHGTTCEAASIDMTVGESSDATGINVKKEFTWELDRVRSQHS